MVKVINIEGTVWPRVYGMQWDHELNMNGWFVQAMSLGLACSYFDRGVETAQGLGCHCENVRGCGSLHPSIIGRMHVYVHSSHGRSEEMKLAARPVKMPPVSCLPYAWRDSMFILPAKRSTIRGGYAIT